MPAYGHRSHIHRVFRKAVVVRYGSRRRQKERQMEKRRGGCRGNSRNRRQRHEWLASPESGFGGDGSKVPCVHCGVVLSLSGHEVEADRIDPSGGYGFSRPYPNVQPSCRSCNAKRGRDVSWAGPLALAALTS